MKVTSALANKILLQLSYDKDLYLEREKESVCYTVAQGEEPEIPEFDFNENCKAIKEIDKKVAKIKHAINVANLIAQIDVLGKVYSVDEILVEMAQLSSRMTYFNRLRKALPKRRLDSRRYSSNNFNAIEYLYINYNVKDAEREYKECQKKVTAMQLALDTYNHSYEFEIDVDYDLTKEVDD